MGVLGGRDAIIRANRAPFVTVEGEEEEGGVIAAILDLLLRRLLPLCVEEMWRERLAFQVKVL